MFKVFKQLSGAYSIRNMTPGSNDHYIHTGNGLYVNKVHPEILPMLDLFGDQGFNSMEDAEAAVEMLIKIDQLRGVHSWRATSHKPLLRAV